MFSQAGCRPDMSSKVATRCHLSILWKLRQVQDGEVNRAKANEGEMSNSDEEPTSRNPTSAEGISLTL